DGPVDMRFGREVEHHAGRAGQLVHDSLVAYVTTNETETRVVADRFEVALVPRVRQLVEDHHLVIRMLMQRHAHELAADETRAAGDEQPHSDVLNGPIEADPRVVPRYSTFVGRGSVVRLGDVVIEYHIAKVEDLVAVCHQRRD